MCAHVVRLSASGDSVILSIKGSAINIAPIEQAWNGITDTRLQEYRDCVPQGWAADVAISDAIDLIRGVRNNIAAALAEVGRVLT